MAKVTDQNVPPEIADEYAKLVTPNKAGAGAATAASASRLAANAKYTATTYDRLQTPQRIVAMMAATYGRAHDTADDIAWRAARLDELRAGTINPLYWSHAPKLAEARLKVTATSEERLPRPAYQYATPYNRPTVTTWSAPVETTDEIGYSGALIDSLYCDKTWTYHAAEYMIPPRSRYTKDIAAMIVITGAANITASHRPSRAMLSHMVAAEVLDQPSPDIATAAPPQSPATSHYYPKRPPVTPPPYYHYTHTMRAMQLPPPSKLAPAGQVLQVRHAPRALFGIANNNNLSVDINWTGDAAVYILQPAQQAVGEIMLKTIGIEAYWSRKLDLATGEITRYKRWPNETWELKPTMWGYLVSINYAWPYIADANTRKRYLLDEIELAGGYTSSLYATFTGYQLDGYREIDGTLYFLRATWSPTGQVLTQETSETPFSNISRAENNWAITPRGHTIASTDYQPAVVNLDNEIIATIDIDPEDDFQIEWACAWGTTIVLAMRSAVEDGHLYLLDTATLPTTIAGDPVIITPRLWMTDYFENWQFAATGELFALRPEGADVEIYNRDLDMVAQWPLGVEDVVYPLPITTT